MLRRRYLFENKDPWYADYKDAVEDQLGEMEVEAQSILESSIPDGIRYARIEFTNLRSLGTPGSYTDPAVATATVWYEFDLEDEDYDLTSRQILNKYKKDKEALLKVVVSALQDVTRIDDTIKHGESKSLSSPGSYTAKFTVRFWTDFDLDNWYAYIGESRSRRLVEAIDSQAVRTATDEIRSCIRRTLQLQGVTDAKIDIRLMDAYSNPFLEVMVISPWADKDASVLDGLEKVEHDYSRNNGSGNIIDSFEIEGDYESSNGYVYKAIAFLNI